MKSNDKKVSFTWFACSKCMPISYPKSQENEHELGKHDMDLEKSKTTQKKLGGWRAMPFILGTESLERLATIGLGPNFQVFLMTVFHMDQVFAANVIFIWSGAANFAPLVGAYISDAFAGRFLTIAYGSGAAFLGLLTLTLIAWIPQLHPPTCSNQQLHRDQCESPTNSQLGILIMALGFMTIASGGIRPCNIPFGVDQFDASTEKGRKGINSFFNWYYISFTVVMIIALTLIVYIQGSISWVLGFGLLTIFMACGVVLFFLGMKIYVYVKPEGSVFSGIAQAIVAAYKKRKLQLPEDIDGVLYDPPLKGSNFMKKLPLTNQFRCLNKGAIIIEGDMSPEGDISNPWRLSSIQQIEQVKCLLRVIPIWASGIISFMAATQQSTFTISQALKMDRHLGSGFEIPPGSLPVISMITIGLWLPLYDRVLVPKLRKITRIEGGITLLQRMGIGIVLSVLSLFIAGFVERKRRASALDNVGPGAEAGIAPVSVFWLAPQLIVMGFAEAFNFIGQIEFYNKEFPENLSSVANSLFACTMAGASYLSTVVVNIVHDVTATRDHPDWLTKDVNKGRVENLYFIIAGMGVLNFVYFLVVARSYWYKSRVWVGDDDKLDRVSVEMNSVHSG